MSFSHVVVDGSNIATEGRSLPSLAQLEDALRELREEYPGIDVTVVVDASFGHRIDKSEGARFEEAEKQGEIVSPPAGAIGRGDAFLLRIAEKTGAAVLSNDSFQEFHRDHEWLFEEGRLIGGKPVSGVGWIFSPRTPVRGGRGRATSTKAAARTIRATPSKEASKPMPVPKKPPPARVRKAIAAASAEAVSDQRRRRRRHATPHDTVNEPLIFITFVADHPLGSRVEAEIESFTSHGAFAIADGARCYVPLSGLGKPPPRRAREVVSKGERLIFVVQALDAPRRGVELALPPVATVTGAPSQETVDADIAGAERKASEMQHRRAGAGAQSRSKRGPSRGRRPAPREKPSVGGRPAARPAGPAKAVRQRATAAKATVSGSRPAAKKKASAKAKTAPAKAKTAANAATAKARKRAPGKAMKAPARAKKKAPSKARRASDRRVPTKPTTKAARKTAMRKAPAKGAASGGASSKSGSAGKVASGKAPARPARQRRSATGRARPRR